MVDGITNSMEKTLGDSEGQGSLACCSPWGCKELDTTERLNSKNTAFMLSFIHHGLEIKIMYTVLYTVLYSKVHISTAT